MMTKDRTASPFFRGRRLFFVTTATLATAWANATEPTASLIDLGAGVRAYGINLYGEVTGCVTASGATRAFIYIDLAMHDLGTLGGANSCGYALNTRRQVTGYAETAAGTSHAFLNTGGTMNDLGTINGASTSVGTSINSGGEVVGYSWQLAPTAVSDIFTLAFKWPRGPLAPGQDPGLYAFSYAQGTMTQILQGDPVSPQAAFATAVNDGGLIAGLQGFGCGFVCPAGQAVVLDNGVATQVAQGVSFVAIPTGINASGAMSAYGEDPSAFMHGLVLTKGATAIDLGKNTVAFGINAGGRVVGASGVPRALPDYAGVTGDTEAFIYSDNQIFNLNVPGAVPTAINDESWIILNHKALDHAYLRVLSGFSLAPTGLTFGNVPVGTASNSRNAACGACTVTLTNHASGAIAVGTISITGPGFSQTNNCPTSLAGGAQCTINVSITPTSTDLTYGQLTVPADDRPYVTVLRAENAPTITLTTSSSDVEVGTQFTLTWNGKEGETPICIETGGPADPGTTIRDSWNNTSNASSYGTATLTESKAGTYTFILTCTGQSQSTSVQQVVTVHEKSTGNGSTGGGSTGGGGGGGAVDPTALLSLLAIWGLKTRIKPRVRCVRDID